METQQIKIVIAFDQQLIADGLAAILSGEKDLNITGCITNEDLAIDLAIEQKPDIIIFELVGWPNRYLDMIKQFAALFPKTKILLISELLSRKHLEKVLAVAHGYMLRTCAARKVIMAIHEIIESGKYVCPIELEEIIINCHNESQILTQREEEILHHWIKVDDNKEIARTMCISESTVRTHLKNIKEKVDGVNKINLMVYACKNNILNYGSKPICPNCKFSNPDNIP